MEWVITYIEFPDHDLDRIVCKSLNEVWKMLDESIVQPGILKNCVNPMAQKEMNRIWKIGNPIEWMKLYNENNILKEGFFVLDQEEGKTLLQ